MDATLLELNSERLGHARGAGRTRAADREGRSYDEELLLREVVQEAPAIAAMKRRLSRLPKDAGY